MVCWAKNSLKISSEGFKSQNFLACGGLENAHTGLRSGNPLDTIIPVSYRLLATTPGTRPDSHVRSRILYHFVAPKAPPGTIAAAGLAVQWPPRPLVTSRAWRARSDGAFYAVP